MINPVLTQFEANSLYTLSDSKAKLYLQMLGSCRGKEKRALLLTNMLLKTDNPYYWLMVVIKRKSFRTQVLTLLAAYHDGLYLPKMIYQKSLRKY